MSDDDPVTVPLRRVEGFSYATVAHPDGMPLHLINIHFTGGEVLEGNALTNIQVSEHIRTLQRHLSIALDNEHQYE